MSSIRKRHDNRDGKRQELFVLLGGGIMIICVGIWYIGHSLKSNSEKNSADQAAASADIAKNQSDMKTITTDMLRQKLTNDENVKLIDIRSKEEYDQEHLLNSVLLGPSALNAFVPEKDTIVVIIYSEADKDTLATAENILEQKSYPSFFIRGGFEAWKQSGNQTITAGDPHSFLDQSKVTYLSVSDLKTRLQGTAPFVLLDVQSKDDYQKKHIQGAINIPLSEIEKRFKEIPITNELIVYGTNDTMSFQGGVRLADLNFFSVKTLSGNDHLTASSGLPLEPK
mgnify:CR=1 FL=1